MSREIALGRRDIAGEAGSELPRPRRAAALFLVAVWALFAALYAGAALDERQIYFGGDQADLLSAADETLRGHPPLVGARSREGLFHPGPLFVYLLAIVQALASGREAWTISTVLLLQATSVLVLSLLTLRLSRSLALAASLPYLFVFSYAFLIYLRFLWNVTIVFPALALAVWLVVSIEPPRPWKLPALAAVLSLIAQAHMGFVLVAGWLGAVALARSILPPRRIRWRDLLPAAGVLTLVWSPVLWEAVRHRGGNLAKVAARFSAPRERHTLSEILGSIDSLLSELIRGGPGTRLALLAASLALLAGASLRRGEWARQLRFLFVAVSGSWIVFLLSERAIPEPIQTYYLRPIWVITAATVIGGASALLSLLRDERFRAAVGLVIAAVVVAVSARPALEMRRLFASPGWNPFPLAEFRIVAAESAARVGPREPRRADVEFQLADLAGAEPSFLYLLRRQGVKRERSVGAPRFRVVKASESPPEDGWEKVLRTEKYRLEAETSPRGPPPASEPSSSHSRASLRGPGRRITRACCGRPSGTSTPGLSSPRSFSISCATTWSTRRSGRFPTSRPGLCGARRSSRRTSGASSRSPVGETPTPSWPHLPSRCRLPTRLFSCGFAPRRASCVISGATFHRPRRGCMRTTTIARLARNLNLPLARAAEVLPHDSAHFSDICHLRTVGNEVLGRVIASAVPVGSEPTGRSPSPPLTGSFHSQKSLL